MSDVNRAWGLVVATVAAALTLAPSAWAGGGNGLLVSNIDVNCYSLTTGNPYSEPMISAIAGWGSEGEAAVVGAPFTSQFSVGVVGHSCSGADIVPTVIPPVGVRVAVDAKHPLQWRYPDENGGGAWNTSGIRALPLPDGTTKLLADDGRGHTTWPIANDRPPLQFVVPLVADRELRGAGSGAGQCPNGPPCAAAEAGDYLQVKVDTTIGTPNVITPVVALFATIPPGGLPAATGLTAASSVRASALRRGLAIKVQAAKGAKLTIALTTGAGKARKTLARGTATAAGAGPVTVRVRPTRAGRAALARAKKALNATIRLTASGTGLATVTRTAPLRITR